MISHCSSRGFPISEIEMKEASKESPVFSLAPGSWYRGFIQGKTRLMLAWVFAIALILLARRPPVLPGTVLCFLGATLRFWASGFLRKDSRPAVGGPYAYTRNPLYLGTFLMGAGAALAIENYGFLAAISVAFIAIYHYIILDEEVKLREIFGEPYSLYCQAVPRFFPRIFPAPRAVLSEVNPDATHQRFSWELARKNKAFEPYWSFVGLILFITLVAYGWAWLGRA